MARRTEASDPAAAVCRGVRTCVIASVCFCEVKNCWAESSTAPPKRPAWDMGELRNGFAQPCTYRPGSASFFWTTYVDIT